MVICKKCMQYHYKYAFFEIFTILKSDFIKGNNNNKQKNTIMKTKQLFDKNNAPTNAPNNAPTNAPDNETAFGF